MLVCSVCKESKTEESFYKSKRPRGRQSRCKQCAIDYAQKPMNKARDQEYKRAQRYKHCINYKHGMNHFDNTTKCECCGVEFGNIRATNYKCVDHTGNMIRGVLCSACNLGIGKLGDDVAGVQRALDYLTDNLTTDYMEVLR